MALLAATMVATPKKLTAKLRAAYFVEVAGLVFQGILPTETRLGGKEWAYGAALIISVAIVGYLWVAAILRPGALVSAGWGLRTTR